MDGWDLIVIVGALVVFAPVSGRLATSPLTSAIVFTATGVVFGPDALGVLDVEIGSDDLRMLAEVTLTLVLFSDAASLDSARLKRQAVLPLRLLTIALPLAIIFGTLVATPLFVDLAIFEAVILAALLAPTDAALGQTVVTDRRLPSTIRQGLSVESGLNDGVCVPIIVAAVAFAELDEQPGFDGGLMVDLVKELSVAVAVGLVVGTVVVALDRFGERRRWMSDGWARILPVATAILAYLATVELHGSGFIGAFVAGLVFGRGVGRRARTVVGLDEELGQMLSATTFLLFGAVMVTAALSRLDVATVVYAVSSLTVVRMVAVAVALLRTGASRTTTLFIGWFGPRGLASIVFALTIVEASGLSGKQRIIDVATIVVASSVLAHGVSAPSLTDRYVRWLSMHHDDLAERGIPTSDDSAVSGAG